MHEDPNHDPAGDSHPDVRRFALCGAGWLWVLITGVLWSLQPWQRPWFTKALDERIWLALSCAGLLVLLVFPWRGISRARLAGRIASVFAGGVLLLGGLPVACENLAVAKLRSMLKDEMPVPGAYYGQKRTREPLARKLHDWLGGIGLGPPKWLSRHVGNLQEEPVTPTHEFIAMSRWPVRRKMAESMLRDPASADFLMVCWSEFFPAIIGRDVTLACRREWLEQLDVLRKELPDSARQTCIAMMALIVLTDPPEFEAWRVSVRDAMLQEKNVVYDVRTGEGQQLWYRLIDTLLVLDPPGSWVRLTGPMTANTEGFGLALEVPVRGLVGHFDAFLEMFESGKNIDDLFSFWQSVGEGLEDHPDSLDPATADRIRIWRRDTLFRFLKALGDGTKYDLSRHRVGVAHVLEFHPVLPFTDDQRGQLAAKAQIWVSKMNDEMDRGMNTASGHLSHIRYVLPYLDEAREEALLRSLIPVMLQPERFVRRNSQDSADFDETWAECLWGVQVLMSDEQQLLLRDRLAPLMANLDLRSASSPVLLRIDAWAKHPALAPEHWLAQAWAAHQRWQLVPKEAPPARRVVRQREPFSVPEIPDETIGLLAGIVDSAMHASGGQPQPFSQIMADRFHFKIAQKSPHDHFVKRLTARMRNWKYYGTSGSEALARELKADLAEKGLYRGDDAITQHLKQRVWDGTFRSGRFLLDPAHSRMLWADTLRDPERAAAEALKSVGRESCYSALASLIQAIETYPPEDRVVQSVWDALRAQSHTRETRREIFGALFRIAHRLPHSERMAMRKDYLDAMPGWSVFTDQSGPLPDLNPLWYAGGGLGIPWEEDELSARFSWMTAVDRQRNLHPLVISSPHRNEVFAWLSNGAGLDYAEDDMSPALGPARLPSPFPPTPWQKARELYGRHPEWFDKAALR